MPRPQTPSDTEKGETFEVLQGGESFLSDFDLAPTGRVLMDPQGFFLRVNPAFCKMLGYAEKDLLERTFSQITHPADLEGSKEAVGRLVNGEIPFIQIEKRYLHRLGHSIWAFLTATLIRDGEGRPVHVVSQIFDISARKEAERALEEKTSQLQAVTEAMMEFLEAGQPRRAFSRILRGALAQTQSEYGFVAAVVEGPTLRVLVHEGFVWDKAVNRALYEREMGRLHNDGYMDFAKLDNLFGKVVTDKVVVATNSPAADPRSAGIPPGHPPLNSFLGVPAIQGNEVVGMIGVANRPQGYTAKEQEQIEILTKALGVLLDSWRRMERESELEAERKQVEKALMKARDELEARVEKRTTELSRANSVLQQQIRERGQIEAALRESEQRFRRAFDHAAIGMALVKPDFSYYLVNASLCKMLGYAEEELLEKTFPSITHPEDLESGELDRTRRLLEGEIDSFRQEKRYFHKGGHIVWALMTVALVRDDDGKPLYFVAEIEDITERKKAEKELRESQQELRRLSGHLESVREEERTRVAREIHDELGQALTGLKLDLAWLAQELEPGQKALIKHAKTMSRLVDETIKSVRSILTALRPAILDDLGLAAAIEWQLQDFRERMKIECQLDLEADEARLAQDRSTAVFRIFQETLTNVARHAQASRVHVNLKEVAGDLVLTVRDNGSGIAQDEMAKPNSFGLLGMRERALLLGGEVKIDGVAKKGTSVTVRIPLKTSED